MSPWVGDRWVDEQVASTWWVGELVGSGLVITGFNKTHFLMYCENINKSKKLQNLKSFQRNIYCLIVGL